MILWTLLGLIESLLFWISKCYQGNNLDLRDHLLKGSTACTCIFSLLLLSLGIYLVYLNVASSMYIDTLCNDNGSPSSLLQNIK